MFSTIKTTTDKLIFNEKVRDLCRSCKRYGKSASCPPYIETLDHYKKAAIQYKNMDIVYKEYNTKEQEDVLKIGKESSLELHEYLIEKRDNKIKQGSLFVVCYGGGSCKICKTCAIPCRLPERSIIPIEATGVNVFETLEQFDIILPSLIDKIFFRVGVILYD